MCLLPPPCSLSVVAIALGPSFAAFFPALMAQMLKLLHAGTPERVRAGATRVISSMLEAVGRAAFEPGMCSLSPAGVLGRVSAGLGAATSEVNAAALEFLASMATVFKKDFGDHLPVCPFPLVHPLFILALDIDRGIQAREEVQREAPPPPPAESDSDDEEDEGEQEGLGGAGNDVGFTMILRSSMVDEKIAAVNALARIGV